MKLLYLELLLVSCYVNMTEWQQKLSCFFWPLSNPVPCHCRGFQYLSVVTAPFALIHWRQYKYELLMGRLCQSVSSAMQSICKFHFFKMSNYFNEIWYLMVTEKLSRKCNFLSAVVQYKVYFT